MRISSSTPLLFFFSHHFPHYLPCRLRGSLCSVESTCFVVTRLWQKTVVEKMNSDEEYEKYANERKREWGNTGELQEVGVRIPQLYFSSAPSPRARDFFNRSSCKISLLPRRSLFLFISSCEGFPPLPQLPYQLNGPRSHSSHFFRALLRA